MVGLSVAAVVHAVPASAEGRAERAVYVAVEEGSTTERAEEARGVLFAADSASYSMPSLYRTLPQLSEDWTAASGRSAIRIADMRVRSPDYGATGAGGWTAPPEDGLHEQGLSSAPRWARGSNAWGSADEGTACFVTIADRAFDHQTNRLVRAARMALAARGIEGQEAVDALWTIVADHEIGHCIHRDGMEQSGFSEDFGAGMLVALNEMMADGWAMAMDYARNGDTRRSEAWFDARMVDLVRTGLLADDHVRAAGSDLPPGLEGRITSSGATSYATPLVMDPMLRFLRDHAPSEIAAMARRVVAGPDGETLNELAVHVSRIARDEHHRFVNGDRDVPDDFLRTVADLNEGIAESQMVDGILVLGPTTPDFFRNGIREASARIGWTPDFEVSLNLGHRSAIGEEEVTAKIAAAFADHGDASAYAMIESQPVMAQTATMAR